MTPLQVARVSLVDLDALHKTSLAMTTTMTLWNRTAMGSEGTRVGGVLKIINMGTPQTRTISSSVETCPMFSEVPSLEKTTVWRLVRSWVFDFDQFSLADPHSVCVCVFLRLQWNNSAVGHAAQQFFRDLLFLYGRLVSLWASTFWCLWVYESSLGWPCKFKAFRLIPRHGNGWHMFQLMYSQIRPTRNPTTNQRCCFCSLGSRPLAASLAHQQWRRWSREGLVRWCKSKKA